MDIRWDSPLSKRLNQAPCQLSMRRENIDECRSKKLSRSRILQDTHLRNVRPASLLPPRTFWKAIICEILPLKWWRIFYVLTRTIDRGRPAAFLGHSRQTIKNWSILSGDKIFSDTVLNCFDKLDNDLRLSYEIDALLPVCCRPSTLTAHCCLLSFPLT